ncbi:MAG TPA: hypothetical protein VIM61_10015 [Chthoniobacterales bacterium]
MRIFRKIRLERLAAKLILLGTAGLMIGLFGGAPSIVADLQAQRENDGVALRQRKIYEAILLAAEPDTAAKAIKLRDLRDESRSFYDAQKLKTPAPWQWAVTIRSGLVVLTGQALNALGTLRLPKLQSPRHRSRSSF